jgi:hypothetical protein
VTALVWDQVGERFYQTGVDHGVLYLQDGTVAVWNGLTSVEEDSNSELKSFYLEGVKFLETLTPSDFMGKLKAYTYPDEFEPCNGVAVPSPGLLAYEQPPKSFNLSYRTKIGNDIDGTELGYKIHILYNVLANPESYTYASLTGTEAVPIEFSWSLTGTPPKIARLRPTVHISIDSRDTPPDILEIIESKLYGTATSNPSLPPITEIGEYFGYRGALLIVDYGDGTWAAIDESDTFITMIDATTFQIDGADATYLDAVTYTVSSTNIGEQG